jgi:peptidoglycan hydrolase-like protein with peptidoglycan-binding domain
LKAGSQAQTTPAKTDTAAPATTTPAKAAEGHDHGHNHGTTSTANTPAATTTPAKPETTTVPAAKPAEGGISASLAASEGILMLGSKGPDVTKLQEQLSKLGYTDAKGQSVKASGDFDQGTKEALMAFEKSRGMEQNGIVGPRTSEALAKAEQAPKLTEASHPDNAMFKKVDGMLGQLPAGTFKNEQERQNAAGSAVYEAKVSGMNTVDKVELNTSRTGLIVSEGNPQTTGNRELVKLEGAVSQSLDKSTQLIAQDASKAVAAPVKVAEAPVKTNEQVEPQKIAVGSR